MRLEPSVLSDSLDCRRRSLAFAGDRGVFEQCQLHLLRHFDMDLSHYLICLILLPAGEPLLRRKIRASA
jgi:hypothetical protein